MDLKAGFGRAGNRSERRWVLDISARRKVFAVEDVYWRKPSRSEDADWGPGSKILCHEFRKELLASGCRDPTVCLPFPSSPTLSSARSDTRGFLSRLVSMTF